MKTLEFITTPVDGKIVIEVPIDLDGIELKVLILEKKPAPAKKFRDMTSEERLKQLIQFKGTARYPDFSTSKYDVYDQ